jgi:F-type H+-transporting ATPase subunit b
MLIDWFTVGAQIINFIILVWLLRHFLYKPILDAVDAREKRISSELADADSKRADANKDRADFEAKNKAFDEQRAVLLQKATVDTKAERERIMDGARKDADALRVRQECALQSDGRKLGGELTRLATKEVFSMARKTLADLATVDLEERIVEAFNRRLREMGGKDKEALAEALRTSHEPALVQSTFDLPSTQRAAVQNALNETFSAAVRIRFEISPETVCGIELTTSGLKLAWSIADYLASLERNVEALLDTRSASPAEPAPNAKAAAPGTPAALAGVR